MKNVTDFCKTVETGVDLHLGMHGQRLRDLLFTENYNGNFLRVLMKFKLNENAITEKKVSHTPLDFLCYRK